MDSDKNEKKFQERLQKRGGFFLPKITELEKQKFLNLKNEMIQEAQDLKKKQKSQKIWRQSNQQVEFQKQLLSKFKRKSKSTANIRYQNDNDEAIIFHNKMRSQFFKKEQIQQIDSALKLVNFRIKSKFSQNIKKESIFDRVQKTKEIYLIKRTTQTIQEEIENIKKQLEKKNENIKQQVYQTRAYFKSGLLRFQKSLQQKQNRNRIKNF